MLALSQRDPRWAQAKLGNSFLTVGRFGCTTACLSMVSDYFGSFVSPLDLAKNQKLYNLRGEVIWKELNFKTMKFVQRMRGRNDPAILASLKDPNGAVILQVNYGQHWIVPLRKTLFLKDFLCNDPWTGRTCAALADYKNITGSAHFVRK